MVFILVKYTGNTKKVVSCWLKNRNEMGFWFVRGKKKETRKSGVNDGLVLVNTYPYHIRSFAYCVMANLLLRNLDMHLTVLSDNVLDTFLCCYSKSIKVYIMGMGLDDIKFVHKRCGILPFDINIDSSRIMKMCDKLLKMEKTWNGEKK